MPLFGRRQTDKAPEAEPDDPMGQNRVFYSRENGIVTYWYLAHRCEEECYRAQRYERPLSLLIVRPAPETGGLAPRLQLAATLRTALRAADVAAYSGTEYIILLPETSKEQAEELATRLRAEVPNTVTGLSAFPEDGADLATLTEVARTQLPPEQEAAA
ncbi:MAG: hypothetical protein WEE64_03035 [Dehalococcoidia bacterium]